MPRKYSKSASKDVERAMHKKKKGTLKSGGSGKTVKSRKQAVAIGLSEARKKGKKVPKKKASSGISRRACPSAARSPDRLRAVLTSASPPGSAAARFRSG
jgi:hypothetical protein